MTAPRLAFLLCVLAVGCTASAPLEPVAERPSAPERAFLAPTEPADDAYVFPRTPVLDCTVLEEVGYRKGRKFPIKVVSIDGRLVELAAADAYWKMQQAAAEDGVELPIYSAFRTNEEQAYFYNCFKTCSCNQCIRAARPGHSNHQSGRAIDFGQWDGVLDWLKENGRRFRFFSTIRKEPWHWQYRPRKRDRRRKPTLCSKDSAD